MFDLFSRRSVSLGLAAVAGAATLLAAPGLAQDCPRPPEMDERFCDADGDLVADVPEDPSEWINPDTLIFAYTPVEDPATYADVWEEFLEHLSEVTGKEVEFFGVESNAAQLEAMRAGRLHVTGFNTGSNPLAVNAVGFRPFAMMASADGSFGYEMEIIVAADSEIETLEDVRGRQMAFTSETSNSGFKAPSALLQAEFEMVAGEDYDTAFSGSHENSILGVLNEDYEVAAIANSVFTRMAARGDVDAAAFRTIYKSETFPTTGYGTVYNLDPEVAEKVQEAFFTFDWEGTKMQAEFGESGEEQFIPITYQEFWGVIRTIDQISGVEYRL